mmetsp:Transcript_77271/g.226615  ORF Transcript_77271/g.226615 Transcript_77271/m.226615 type:complete len:220 (+) Transcript_77271:2501-3160(+)
MLGPAQLLFPPGDALVLRLLPLELLPAWPVLPVRDRADVHRVVRDYRIVVLTLEGKAGLHLGIAAVHSRRAAAAGDGRGAAALRALQREAGQKDGVINAQLEAGSTHSFRDVRALWVSQPVVDRLHQGLVLLVLAHHDAPAVGICVRLVDEEVEPLALISVDASIRDHLKLYNVALQDETLHLRRWRQLLQPSPEGLDVGAQQRLAHRCGGGGRLLRTT